MLERLHFAQEKEEQIIWEHGVSEMAVDELDMFDDEVGPKNDPQ